MNRTITALLGVVLSAAVAGCAGGSVTTREKGAGIGALGGAAIGGALGLGAVALVGDQLQGNQTSRPAEADR